MSKKLVIVESPAKAKTISSFLDPSYEVEASFGHVRDLPQSAKDVPAEVKKQKWSSLGVDIDNDFSPLYIIPKDKAVHVSRLKKAAKDAVELLLATDEDREGESISWHVLQVLKPKANIAIKRIVFHEITREAIERALLTPRDLDESLVKAQEARRVLDRLYGYSLSPLLWKKVMPGLSAGRVQSVAVRLCVERERERIQFVPANYWDITASLKAEKGNFDAKLHRIDESKVADGQDFDPKTGKIKSKNTTLLTQEIAKQLAETAKNSKPWTITKAEKKTGEQKPAQPFTTSTLQQEANRKLRYTTKRTMQIAQQLYEGIDLQGERVGLITYMRTDSVVLSETALQQARKVIRNLYGEEYLPDHPIRYKTKTRGAQEAHEAIRPTDLSRMPQDVAPYLSDEQFKIYELIWKRTLASQMKNAKVMRTSVECTVEVAGKQCIFTASGKAIDFPGYLRAYVEGSDDPESELGDKETILPPLQVGQEVKPLSVKANGHTTKPPARYTEASLVKKLEEEGIGRPSTYAVVIGTIQERGYINKRGNELIPTFTAFAVTELLEKNFKDLVETEFTARLEAELDDIAEGDRQWTDPLKEFYFGDSNQPGLLKRIQEGENNAEYPLITIGKDPQTNEMITIKIGKYGPFIQRGEGGKGNVVGIPDSIAPDEINVNRAIELLNQKENTDVPIATDPLTNLPIFLRSGRFGDYLEIPNDENKPKRVSIPKGLSNAEVTPEIAIQLMSLPRVIGTDPATNEEIVAGIGRFGPFIKRGSDYRSLQDWQSAISISLEEALHLLAQPKYGKGTSTRYAREVLNDFGELKVLNGRYGPYVTDGNTNATIPKGTDPKTISESAARELIEKKAASGSTAKRYRKR